MINDWGEFVMHIFMRYKVIFFCFLLLLMSIIFIVPKEAWFFENHSCEQFQKIEHYREVQKVFDSCDKQTLITFDVDDTLITARDSMANIEVPMWFKICVAFRYPSLVFSRSTFEWFVSIIFQQTEHFVFDPDIVRYIQQLREQGCTVVALTSMDSGAFGVIKNMPKWRADMLHSFGIDLRGQFQDATFITLPKYHEGYPCLYKGILCANQEPKGQVLGAFLDYYQLKPARIISFDDSARALCSITRECAKRGISFAGYQCLGAKKLPGQWSNRRAFLQLDYVMKHAQWLSDKQADAIFETKRVNAFPFV